MLRRSLFLHPDAPAAAPAAPAAPAQPAVPPARQLDDLTTRLIAQHGSVENALRQLVTQSITTDTTIADLRREVADFKAKLPDGSIVLPKTEAENYAKVVALKLTPDEIVTGLKERDALKGETSKHALEKLARESAATAGLDPDAFAAHAQTQGLHIELKDVTVVEKGKSVVKKVPHVRPAADDKAALVPLSDYTTTLPAYDQRALKATAPAPTPTGVPFVEQRPTPTGSPSPDAQAADALIASTVANLPPGLLPATR